MYIQAYNFQNKEEYPIYIKKSISAGGKKSKKTIRKWSSWKELGNTVEEALKKAEEILKELEDEENNQGKVVNLTLKLTEPIKEKINCKKNAGMLFLLKAWSDLKIGNYLRKWKFDTNSKIEYSINDTLQAIVFSRIIYPGSKLYTSKIIDNYIKKYDVNIDDIYDILDRIPKFEKGLTKYLNKRICEEYKDESNSVFYDCTNFYFEIQNGDEEGIRKYGVEKNHRPDPIVEYGLLYTGNGIPIGSLTFDGNGSESKSLIPALKECGEEITSGKIICADGGLNTEENKRIIHSTGRNYIFVQSIKKLPIKKDSKKITESIREWVSNGKDLVKYNEGTYYKSRWIIRTSKYLEKLIVRFSEKDRKFQLKVIEKRIERANDMINNPSKYNKINSQDGKEYIKKISFNKKTGEIEEKDSILELDKEKIELEKREAGYFCVVTDIPSFSEEEQEYRKELRANNLRCKPLEITEILKIGHKRVDIEACFRVMKTNFKARPIYVRTEEHIKAHLFTVYLALVLFVYLKKKYNLNDFTDEELFAGIRNYELDKINDDLYRIISCELSTLKMLEKLNLEFLLFKNVSNKKIFDALRIASKSD